MRISTNLLFTTGLADITRQGEALLKTQTQITSGKKINRAADDPAATTRIVDLNRAILGLSQLQRNAAAATTALDVSERAVDEATTLLQGIRETMLAAGGGGNTATDFGHHSQDLQEKLDQLLDLANTRDAAGDYIFAGSRVRTPPVVRQGDGSYLWQGDQQGRDFKVGPSRSVQGYQSGFSIFVDVPTGNGVVTGSAGAANGGQGVLTQVATGDPATYSGESFEVRFTAPDRYDLVNVTTGATVAVGQPFTPGDTLSFDGIDATIEGAPVAGDLFRFDASASQDIFTGIQQVIDTLAQANASNVPAVKNALNRGLERLDQGLSRVSDAQVRIGNRLAVLEDIGAANDSFDQHFREQLSQLQDTDYNAAAAQLSAQANHLQFAQAAFARIQNLTLFDFI